MAAPTDLSVLLRLYSGKQNTPTLLLHDFCEYIQKYARHYSKEVPEMSMYLENTYVVVLEKLEELEEAAKIFLSTDNKGRKLVFVPQFYIDKILNRFKEIEERTEVPFPLSSELPQDFPQAFLKQVYITTDFTDQIENQERSNAFLNQLIFPDETTPMLYPGSISPEKLLDISMSKIRLFLRKDDSRDYIQKRLMVANPGKELAIKNHLIQFQTRPSESLRALKYSNESFTFWSYLCSFIRQDYVKKSEKTPEETSLLQSIFITEYMNNYYKNKSQQDLQRETALKNLEMAFQKPPLFFDMETISRFTDSRGVPLLGQYKKNDLESFIKDKTEEGGLNSLPILLVFKANNNRYFVLKEKIVPLLVKLCNDSRKTFKDSITKEWYQLMSGYRQEDAMKNQNDFEKKLDGLCKTLTPILHSLLNASFIPLLAMEGIQTDEQSGFKLFDHGRLLSLSELLILNRQELLTDTRIMLPFWYTLPIISSLLAFFHRPRTKKSIKTKKIVSNTQEKETQSRPDHHDSQKKKKEDLKHVAKQIEKKLIPEGSNLDAEMSTQIDLWNRNLDPHIKENLTDDVNSLIRDYIRQILKTIKASTFDLARVENLAVTLVDTPSLMRIKNRDSLLSYIKLYIIKIISNLN
ncbi:MAG TPA: hypothetical protein VJ861_02115 [Treponemataceae bacterium]|nr:hypothetical protein [Treponemataceae bacterium]